MSLKIVQVETSTTTNNFKYLPVLCFVFVSSVFVSSVFVSIVFRLLRILTLVIRNMFSGGGGVVANPPKYQYETSTLNLLPVCSYGRPL